MLNAIAVCCRTFCFCPAPVFRPPVVRYCLAPLGRHQPHSAPPRTNVHRSNFFRHLCIHIFFFALYFQISALYFYLCIHSTIGVLWLGRHTRAHTVLFTWSLPHFPACGAGDDFRRRLIDFTKPYLKKTIPSLFSALKSLYRCKEKVPSHAPPPLLAS